jgi:CopG family transcriptional regulator, nickel-responsive regulator
MGKSDPSKKGAVRICVSLEPGLLDEFDRLADGVWPTRSEAVRQAVRALLTQEAKGADGDFVTAALTIIYDHRLVGQKLANLQRKRAGRIVSNVHVQIDRESCLEVILMRGPSGELQSICEEMRGLKGIYAGQLVPVRPTSRGLNGSARNHAKPAEA